MVTPSPSSPSPPSPHRPFFVFHRPTPHYPPKCFSQMLFPNFFFQRHNLPSHTEDTTFQQFFANAVVHGFSSRCSFEAFRILQNCKFCGICSKRITQRLALNQHYVLVFDKHVWDASVFGSIEEKFVFIMLHRLSVCASFDNVTGNFSSCHVFHANWWLEGRKEVNVNQWIKRMYNKK